MHDISVHAEWSDRVREAPVIGIVRLRTPDAPTALQALAEGGLRLVEVTLTTPGALEAIAIGNAAGGPAWVGAGSVTTRDEARTAIDAGARFLVTPVMDEDVLAEASAHDVPVVCGAFTPTEILRAQRHGAALVKVFPASGLGSQYVREILAPMPGLNLVPTGGVTTDNIPEWIDAGATAVALGSALVSDAIAQSGQWSDVTSAAAGAVAVARAASATREAYVW